MSCAGYFEVLKPARRVRFTSAMVWDLRHPEHRLRHLLAIGGVAPDTAVQAQSFPTLADVEQLGERFNDMGAA
jgi:hypothetical protein